MSTGYKCFDENLHGDWNSGRWNSGRWNSGNRNSGHRNSGDRNSGNRNSGDWNSGNLNSGHWNSGNRNSGDWNSTNYSSGIFCSEQEGISIFNVKTNITMNEFVNDDSFHNIRKVIYNYELPLTYWLSFDNMSDDEKEQYKQFECQGGVLLNRNYKEACAIWWESIPDNLKEEFVNWEYFNAEVFEEITGIKV